MSLFDRDPRSSAEDCKQHEERKKLYSIKKDAMKYKRQLNVGETHITDNENITTYAKRTKQVARLHGLQLLENSWKEKPLHGKYPTRIQEADVDTEGSNLWLKSAGLKAETEGLIVAAQDQSLATRAYHKYIIKDGTPSECRMCGQFDETVDHIVSGCPNLARNEYIQRHNKIAAALHWTICRHFNIETTDKWYEHTPNTVMGNDSVSILWDMPIITDREIRANRPDIVIKDQETKTCTLIDVSVPSDRNTSTKFTEKLSKYKDLEIEINRMWNLRTQVVPVIVGALGVIKKGTERHLTKLPGDIKIRDIQKTALLGSAHILRKTLSINV